MLRCRNLTVRPEGDPAAAPILDQATAWFRPGAMNALIGPSGCGKTTLVKAMLGLVPVDVGGEVWLGADRIARPEDLLGRVGFAPQFSIAQPKLTVEECLRYGLELGVADAAVRAERLERVLGVTGLAGHRHKRVESLSGGQLRRLGLGLELTVDPPTLICDEVTSGLDPVSENTILDMLRGLARERDKTVVCIIHNLAKLDYFDWVTVVYAGAVIFQGDYTALRGHFGTPDAVRLYDTLNTRPVEHWREKWAQARAAAPGPSPDETEAAAVAPAGRKNGAQAKGGTGAAGVREEAAAAAPGAGSQLGTLLRRRTRLLWRDHGYLSLMSAITFGFPIMVVIFALGGLPQISTPPPEPQGAFAGAIMEQIEYTKETARTASLVTGLIMFQVILLTLMGSNNGAREIAGERLLYEKERLTGLRPGAYVASKLVFTGILAAAQGVWMTVFVKYICNFPGPLATQAAMLALSCVAMTWVCLAFSAVMTSAEKASTLSIYLVGFQLPLSGVVLALPGYMVWVCRPFINGYWGWAGYMSSMKDTRIYDAYTNNNIQTVVEGSALAAAVLGLHALAGAVATAWGCRRRRWGN